jgi:hypothetical protein
MYFNIFELVQGMFASGLVVKKRGPLAKVHRTERKVKDILFMFRPSLKPD